MLRRKGPITKRTLIWLRSDINRLKRRRFKLEFGQDRVVDRQTQSGAGKLQCLVPEDLENS